MLVIDGDLYVYKAGFANRKKEVGFKLMHRDNTQDIDLGNISLTEAKKYCKDNSYNREEWKLMHYNNPISLWIVLSDLDKMISKLMQRFGDPEYKMYITSSDYSNYRFKIATIKPYKGSRSKCVKCFERCSAEFDKYKNTIYKCKHCGEIPKECTFSDKPHYYNEIRDHLVNKWGAELVYNQEADDAVSIEAFGTSNIMIHIDKDINNTPGKHYNPDNEETYIVSSDEALMNFYSQFLLGDNIDCIVGVPGCGKVYARELLADCVTREEYEMKIFEIFQGNNFNLKGFKNKMNLTPDEAYDRLREVGQLLHIRQQENELWEPLISLQII